MSNDPGPFRQSLSRASIVGAGLAVFAIILFLVLWGFFGQAGLSSMPRLIGALCIPPAVVAALIGAYILFIRGNNTPKQ